MAHGAGLMSCATTSKEDSAAHCFGGMPFFTLACRFLEHVDQLVHLMNVVPQRVVHWVRCAAWRRDCVHQCLCVPAPARWSLGFQCIFQACGKGLDRLLVAVQQRRFRQRFYEVFGRLLESINCDKTMFGGVFWVQMSSHCHLWRVARRSRWAGRSQASLRKRDRTCCQLDLPIRCSMRGTYCLLHPLVGCADAPLCP